MGIDTLAQVQDVAQRPSGGALHRTAGPTPVRGVLRPRRSGAHDPHGAAPRRWRLAQASAGPFGAN
jgi:hypothetical protein